MEIDREKVKLIVRNLKLLVEALESEVLSDVDAYRPVSYTHLTLPTICSV